MTDALIRCSEGCGETLTFQRLREGRRRPRGVMCERCAARRLTTDGAKIVGLKGDDARAFVEKAVAWIMDDTPPAPNPRKQEAER